MAIKHCIHQTLITNVFKKTRQRIRKNKGYKKHSCNPIDKRKKKNY